MPCPTDGDAARMSRLRAVERQVKRDRKEDFEKEASGEGKGEVPGRHSRSDLHSVTWGHEITRYRRYEIYEI